MQPGAKLGPYEIVAPIGAGGMGEVYRARDTRLNRIVAVKVSKADFSERFEREARVVASLNHPNIASLYDVGPNYLVMEYVEGEPLHGPLPVDKVLQYAGQICDALDAAHRKGVTHRDLKPANILVNKQGIKLLDFGLAKIREEPEVSEETISKALTAKGAVLGTPQYMAPEQVEGKEADCRTDIFALGCVLYEMLTGRKAFSGKNASSIAAAILAKDPEPIANLQPAFQRVVLTCLAKDPDERFQNALDVKLALLWGTQPDSPPVAEKKWLPWAVTAAFGVALGMALGLLYFRQSSQVPERAVQFQIQAPENIRFSNDTGDPFSVSPDGKMVVFMAYSQDNKGSLWIHPLDSATSRPLPGTEGAFCPFWSPDSRFVAFTDGKKLRRIEAAGGTPQTICATNRASLGTWNQDGDILLPTGISLTHDERIRKVAASGGVPSDLLKPDQAAGETVVADPSFLPDGKHFLFTGSGSGQSVFATSLDGKGGRKLVLEKAFNARFMPVADPKRAGFAGYLLYKQEGNSLMARPFDPDRLAFAGEAIQITENVDYYSASATGVLVWQNRTTARKQITWLDEKGKTLGTVGTPEDMRSLSLSPDRRRVALERTQSDRQDVWTLDLDRGVFSRLTSGEASKGAPVWSRRGSRIFFTQLASTGATMDLYSIGPDGGSAEPFLQSPTRKFAMDTSPDERFLIYSEFDGSVAHNNLWAMPLQGDRKPFPVVKGQSGVSEARLSPDGRWIAYVSDESGATQVFIKPFPPTDQRWQISNEGGAAPRWRADGRQLYYRRKRSRLIAVDLKLGTTVEVSKPRELFSAPVPGLGDYESAPDGKRFLALVDDQAMVTAPPLNVIVNFPTTLLRSRP